MPVFPAITETNINRYNKAFYFCLVVFHDRLLSLIFLYFYGCNVEFYTKSDWINYVILLLQQTSEFYLVGYKQLSLNNTELVLPDLVCGINTKITVLTWKEILDSLLYFNIRIGLHNNCSPVCVKLPYRQIWIWI